MKNFAVVVLAATTGLGWAGCEEKKAAAFKDSAKNAGAAVKDMAAKGADAVKETAERAGSAVKKGVEEAQKEFNKPAEAPVAEAGPLEMTMATISGENASLTQYKGKVVMFVNVASKCGYTPQYEALEALYMKKKDDGFVVLGFPANNFKAQEPGTNAEILAFCTDTYGVTFPMYGKISVVGADQHELYKRLSAGGGGEPKWNFTKYLVDRRGKVVAKYDSKTKPDDAALVAKIDELLAQP